MQEAIFFIKKYRYWIIGGIIVLAILYSLINRFINPPKTIPNPSPIASPTQPVTNTPSTSLPNPTPTESGLLAAHLRFADLDTTSDTLYYYDLDTNELKKTDVESNQGTVLGTLSAYVNNLSWSPDHTKVLITAENSQGSAVTNPIYQDNLLDGATFTGLYEIGREKLTVLDNHIVNASFITSDRIIYEYKSDTEHNLAIAQPDGSNWKNIATLSDSISFARANQSVLVGAVGGKILRIDATGKTMENYSIPEGLTLAQSAWAASGLQSVFYIREEDQLIVKRLNGSAIDSVKTIKDPGGEITIMWDNSKGTIYLATEDGLVTIAAKP